MPDPSYDTERQQGRARARSTAVWDPRFGSKDFWEAQMSKIPHDAIGADQTKHADHNSYSPKFWYVDQRFRCVDCGTSELWTAEAQRWWFEVAKGPIYSEATRCSACRKAWQEQPGRVSHAKRQERIQNK